MKAHLLNALLALAAAACGAALNTPAGADDKAPRWLNAQVDGRTVAVYGWMENGFVRYWPSQNTHLSEKGPITAGVTPGVQFDRSGDGSLNAGVEMQEAGVHANQLDTNDPAFAEKFYNQGQDEGGNCRPDRDPFRPDRDTFGERDNKFVLAVAAVLAFAGAFAVVGLSRRSQPQ